MTIKHDNIIPSASCGKVATSTGLPNALVGNDAGSALSVGVGQARVLGAIQQAVGGPGSPDFKFYNNSRTLVNNQLPAINLPPPALYQVPGNANSTDYACGSQARRRTQEMNEPEEEFPELPPPVVTLEILGIYESNYSLPLGYDPTLKATELLIGTDFYVNLRIRPSVGLAGLGAGTLDPTIFTLDLVIDGTSYPMPAGFPGWLAGDDASNFTGDFYCFPGSYLGQTGIATMSFTGGQPTINVIFGMDSASIPVTTTGCVVTASVQQLGWFQGIFLPGLINTVYVGPELQLVVNGPVSAPFRYSLPWASGTGTTDATGLSIIAGINTQQAGNWNFTVDFYTSPQHTQCNNPLNQPFVVLQGKTAQPKSNQGWPGVPTPNDVGGGGNFGEVDFGYGFVDVNADFSYSTDGLAVGDSDTGEAGESGTNTGTAGGNPAGDGANTAGGGGDGGAGADGGGGGDGGSGPQ